MLAAPASLVTCTLSPKPRPLRRPGTVSGTNIDDIDSTVFGLSRRLPFNCPSLASIWLN